VSTTIRPFFGVKPPRAGDPVSYVIDLHGTPKTTYGHESEPYPPAATWVRMAMGKQTRVPTEKLLQNIVRYLERFQTTICEVLGMPEEYRRTDPDGIAAMLLAYATLIEIGSSLAICTVWPNGYAEFWSWRAQPHDYHAPYIWNHLTGEWIAAPVLDGEGE